MEPLSYVRKWKVAGHLFYYNNETSTMFLGSCLLTAGNNETFTMFFERRRE